MQPHLNGRLADGPPPNPLTVQTAERLVRKVFAEAVDLSAFQHIFDPYDLLVDTTDVSKTNRGNSALPLAYYRQSQKRGEDLPYYYDENQLRFIRDRQRKLVAENPFAQCAIANYTNYCVGADGLKLSAVSARKDCPPRLTERAQRVVDLFIEENEFGEYCKDRVAQGHINGDAPTRLFPDEDSGILRIRPIESEHVRTPAIGGNPYGPEYSFGVQTLPDDVEQIVGVWVVEEPLISPLPKFVPHDQVNWLKFNSPRSAKRGIPLFARGSCEYLLRMAMRLLSAAGSTAIQRAKIGLIKYLDGVINDAAKRLAAEVTDYTVTNPGSGQVKTVQEYPDGAIIAASGNQRWEMPGSNFDAQVFEVAGKMILRAVAAYLNFPEFMLTADPSSGTFANAFIAEAPSTRMFESFQKDFIRRVATNRSRSRRSIVWAQIVHAVKCGILAPETLHLVQIQAEGPSMVVRDTNAEAATNTTYMKEGVMSRKTAQMKAGLDPEQEDENIAKEQAVAAKRQAALPRPAKEDPDGRGPGEREPDEEQEQTPGAVTESAHGDFDETKVKRDKGKFAKKAGKGSDDNAAEKIPVAKHAPPKEGNKKPSERMEKIAREHDERTKERKSGGFLGKLASKVRSMLGGGGKAEPAEEKDTPSLSVEAQHERRKNFNYHITTVKAQVETMGVKDLWGTDLRRSPAMRSQAVSNPAIFAKKLDHIETGLKTALKFADGNQAAQDAIKDKLADIAKLQEDVAKFHAEFMPETLPDHRGKKGAAHANTAHAIEHLDKGGDVKSAVKAVMQHGGVSEGTAKRYVRAAVKQMAAKMDKTIELMKEDVIEIKAKKPGKEKPAGKSSEPAKATEEPKDTMAKDKDHTTPPKAPTVSHDEQAAAMKKYTGGAYRSLNKQLRAGKEPTNPKDKEVHQALQAAFEQAKPLEKPIEAYRGLSIKSDAERQAFLGKLADAQKTGGEISMGGYTSTTADPQIADNFVAGNRGRGIVFKIEASKMLDLSKHSKIPEERELLMNHDSKFTVHGVEKSPEGHYVVKLKEV